MSFTVDKLIREAQDRPLSKVLPNAIRFAQSADVPALVHWAKLELFGYLATNGEMNDNVVVPEYRTVSGQWFDEYRRPLVIQQGSTAAIVNQVRMRQGVHELETLAQSKDIIAMRVPGYPDAIREHLEVNVSIFRFGPASLTQVLVGIRAELINRLLSTRGSSPVGFATRFAEAPPEEIIELRPNFMGLGVNLRALWRRCFGRPGSGTHKGDAL